MTVEILYHVSPTPGLTTLTPHVSSHGKPYVYAIDDLTTGLLFGVHKDDFDFLISAGEDGIPDVYECYPGAFQQVYEGKNCSVYEVSGDTFLRGMTSWSPELVSETAVPVLREIPVPDLYSALLDREKQGALRIHPYDHSPEYRALIAGQLVTRLILFNMDLETLPQTDPRFATHFASLVEALHSAMDGHLLP